MFDCIFHFANFPNSKLLNIATIEKQMKLNQV